MCLISSVPKVSSTQNPLHQQHRHYSPILSLFTQASLKDSDDARQTTRQTGWHKNSERGTEVQLTKAGIKYAGKGSLFICLHNFEPTAEPNKPWQTPAYQIHSFIMCGFISISREDFKNISVSSYPGTSFKVRCYKRCATLRSWQKVWRSLVDLMPKSYEVGGLI